MNRKKGTLSANGAHLYIHDWPGPVLPISSNHIYFLKRWQPMIWDLMNLEELSGIWIAGAPLEECLFATFHRVSEPWNADPKGNYPDTRSI
jgi:hypothetical protein